jgi:hypothetical protein
MVGWGPLLRSEGNIEPQGVGEEELDLVVETCTVMCGKE